VPIIFKKELHPKTFKILIVLSIVSNYRKFSKNDYKIKILRKPDVFKLFKKSLKMLFITFFYVTGPFQHNLRQKIQKNTDYLKG